MILILIFDSAAGVGMSSKPGVIYFCPGQFSSLSTSLCGAGGDHPGLVQKEKDGKK
jgi:hypothetical protein